MNLINLAYAYALFVNNVKQFWFSMKDIQYIFTIFSYVMMSIVSRV